MATTSTTTATNDMDLGRLRWQHPRHQPPCHSSIEERLSQQQQEPAVGSPTPSSRRKQVAVTEEGRRRLLHRWTCTTRRSLATWTSSLLPSLPPESGAGCGTAPLPSSSATCPKHLRCASPSVASAGTPSSASDTVDLVPVATRWTEPTAVTGLRPRQSSAHKLSHRNHSNRPRHPIYWSLCHSPRNHLLSVLVLIVVGLLPLPGSVMARPTSPKWTNPCGIDLSSMPKGPSSVDVRGSDALEAYANIVSATEAAEEHTANTKKEFVEETFGDPDFMKEFEWLSYDWLPKIADPSEEHLGNLDIIQSLNKSFEYMQYFAVAIDQLILDQLVYEGNFVGKFRRMETDLATVLCQMQTAMLKLRVTPNPGVTKEVMSEEERTVESETTRNVRDFIIMRDYQKALRYIAKVFKYFLATAAASSAAT